MLDEDSAFALEGTLTSKRPPLWQAAATKDLLRAH